MAGRSRRILNVPGGTFLHDVSTEGRMLLGLSNWRREIVGLALVALYMGLLPPILARTVLRRFWEKMGTARFVIGVNLALIMLALPIKMYLRWIFNLKYLVFIPEFSFNI